MYLSSYVLLLPSWPAAHGDVISGMLVHFLSAIGDHTNICMYTAISAEKELIMRSCTLQSYTLHMY